MPTMAQYYQHLRSGGKRPNSIPKLWKQWLWEVDCTAPATEACGDMNHMHALGLLLCFMEEAYPSNITKRNDDEIVMISIQHLLPNVPLVHLYGPKPISQFTLRELITQLECLQLSWGQILSNSELEHVDELLRSLMARLGYLAHNAFPENDVLDDPQYITQSPGKSLFIITRKCLRQLICIFFILYRHKLIFFWFILMIRIIIMDLQGTSYHSTCTSGT